jgi:glycosyltransferase involved in cell wall biosynthesis
MKILRIIARLNVGGPARHVVWLTQALQDDEFQTTLVAGSIPPGEDDMAYFAAENGVRPVYLREMTREITPSDLRSLFKLYRRIKAEKPDIIHTHTAKAGTLGRIAGSMYRWITPRTLIGRPRRVRMVHTFHGHVFHSYYSPSKTRIFLAIERMLARASDRIIVLSEQQFEEIHLKYRVGRREQFSIVPLGVDADQLAPDAVARKKRRSDLGIKESDIVVGFVGRLTEIKNISLLLQTAALLADTSNIKFLIIGDGHLRQSLEREAAETGAGKNTEFIGNRSDIAELYNALDIVALTSLNEGTPLSLIEAMAAGKAVVSSGVGGVRDLLGEVTDERERFTVCERGIRVETFEPNDFRAGLIYLITNEQLRRELAERGKEYVRSKYGKQRLIDDIKRLYGELNSE